MTQSPQNPGWGPPSGAAGQPWAQPGRPPQPSGGWQQGQWQQPTGSWPQPSFGYPPPSGQPAGPGPYPGPAGPGPVTTPAKGISKVVLAAVGLVVLVMVGIAVATVLSQQGPSGNEGYVNEGYKPPPPNLNPPPLPNVETVQQAEGILEDSPFYQQSVPGPTRCEVDQIDMSTASPSQKQAHLNTLVGCLMRVWEKPVTDAGFQMPRPSVTVYTKPITTACGKLPPQNAVYCGADQQIYFADDVNEALPSELQNARFLVETIVAHEFGHAIQARTGLLISAKGLASVADSDAEANALVRRLELQADCFSGEFLRSVATSAQMTQADLDTIAQLAYYIGDDVLSGDPNYDGEHGLGRNRQYWVQVGIASTEVAACQTFTASAESTR